VLWMVADRSLASAVARRSGAAAALPGRAASVRPLARVPTAAVPGRAGLAVLAARGGATPRLALGAGMSSPAAATAARPTAARRPLVFQRGLLSPAKTKFRKHHKGRVRGVASTGTRRGHQSR